MAKRMLDGRCFGMAGFWELSDKAKVLYLGLKELVADRWGRGEWEPGVIWAKVFLKAPRMTPEKVARLMAEVEAKMPDVLTWRVGESRCFALSWWPEVNSKPGFGQSEIPDPPEDLAKQIPLWGKEVKKAAHSNEGRLSLSGEAETPLERVSQVLVKEPVPVPGAGPARITNGVAGSQSISDLTDYEMTTLREAATKGTLFLDEWLLAWWQKNIGELRNPAKAFERWHTLGQPVNVEKLALALTKTRKYGAGEHHSPQYLVRCYSELVRDRSKDKVHPQARPV